MKAILEFKLPDERWDFTCAQKGTTYLRFIENMYNYLRSKAKSAYTEAESSICNEIFDHFIEELNEEGINLWDEN